MNAGTFPEKIDGDVAFLTPEESRQVLTREVFEATGLSSIEEFLAHLKAGEWDEVIDDPDHRAILMLASFLDS